MGVYMKKLLIAIMAIGCMHSHAQASWATAAKIGFASFLGTTPLIGSIVYQGDKLSEIHQSVLAANQAAAQINQSVLAATAAGNALTAELAKFTPIMNSPAFHDKSSMSWSEWAASGSKDFASHVISTVLTTIIIQVLMNAAMSSMQNAATAMIIQEDDLQVKAAVPAPVHQAQQPLTPAEIARRRRVVQA